MGGTYTGGGSLTGEDIVSGFDVARVVRETVRVGGACRAVMTGSELSGA